MSKGKGQKIAIKFDKPLLGDVTGNESAFTITGMQRNPLGVGELELKTYTPSTVERYPVSTLYEDDFTGTLDGVEVGGNGVVLILPEIPFSPADINGLVMWLDAGQGVTKDENDLVGEWADQSGEAHHATSSGGERPTFVDGQVSGKPVVRFSGSQAMDYPDLGITNFTAFIVLKASYPSAIEIIMSHDPLVFGFRPASTDMYIRNGSRMANWGAFNSGEPNILSYTYGTPTLHYNGVEDSYGANANVGSIGRFIGKRATGNNLNGDIAEIIVYNNALSSADREAVEAYLSEKYSITLGGA